MNRLLVVVTVAGVIACPILASPETARSLNKRIDTNGARKTLTIFAADTRQWSEFQKRVAGGSWTFMKVALRLYQAADGQNAEDIQHAFGEALKVAPRSVLTIAPSDITISRLCGSPDVDDERFDSREKAMRELHRRRAAVARIKDQEHQQECLSALNLAKTHVDRFFKK